MYEVSFLATCLAIALFWTRSCLVVFVYLHIYIYTFLSIYTYSFCVKVIWALWHFNKGSNWQKAKDSFRSNQEKEIPEHMMLEGFRWSISHLANRLVYLAWPYWSLGCFLKTWWLLLKHFKIISKYTTSIQEVWRMLVPLHSHEQRQAIEASWVCLGFVPSCCCDNIPFPDKSAS